MIKVKNYDKRNSIPFKIFLKKNLARQIHQRMSLKLKSAVVKYSNKAKT